MERATEFDVIIVGGSYAGLAAGMALGRSLRKTLIIDSGDPCNKQTPHSHNFLTQDGRTPAEIVEIAREQVLKYSTVSFCEGMAAAGRKTASGFEISTGSGSVFRGKKLIFATGIKDRLPDMEGFADCWGISVIHCPYCHGYEVRGKTTGIFANGEPAFEMAKLISNWTDDLTLFTDGPSGLSGEQVLALEKRNIRVVESGIGRLRHEGGRLRSIVFKERDSEFALEALYARVGFRQHCDIPQELGCELTEEGRIKVDMAQRTSVKDVFACGDSTNMMRSVAHAVASGTLAGAMANKELIDEEF